MNNFTEEEIAAIKDREKKAAKRFYGNNPEAINSYMERVKNEIVRLRKEREYLTPYIKPENCIVLSETPEHYEGEWFKGGVALKEFIFVKGEPNSKKGVEGRFFSVIITKSPQDKQSVINSFKTVKEDVYIPYSGEYKDEPTGDDWNETTYNPKEHVIEHVTEELLSKIKENMFTVI